jgi:hypothetical protein
MQADAEHQQHHTDLGELACDLDVRHESRRRRADHHAREQVTDEGGNLQAHRHEPEHQRETKRGRDRGNEGDGMRHHDRIDERQIESKEGFAVRLRPARSSFFGGIAALSAAAYLERCAPSRVDYVRDPSDRCQFVAPIVTFKFRWVRCAMLTLLLAAIPWLACLEIAGRSAHLSIRLIARLSPHRR